MKRKKTHRQKERTGSKTFLKNNRLPLLLLLMGIALLQSHTAYAQTKHTFYNNNGGQGEYIQNTNVNTGGYWGVSLFANHGEQLRVEGTLITAFPRIHAIPGSRQWKHSESANRCRY